MKNVDPISATQYSTLRTTYTYDGRKITVTDPDGKKKSEINDFLGRLVEVIEYHGESGYPYGTEYHTYYGYNAAGDLLTVSDNLIWNKWSQSEIKSQMNGLILL